MSLKVDVLSIYYLRIAEFLLVGNPTIIKKILDEDLSQGLQGEKCLFLAPPTFKKAFFPACFFKNFREYADKKRTLKSLLQLLQHTAKPPIYPPPTHTHTDVIWQDKFRCATVWTTNQSVKSHKNRFTSWCVDAPLISKP